MPPVFSPVSPSPTRLWSWAATNGATRSPSLNTKNDSSSPTKHSSSTTRAPAPPHLAAQHFGRRAGRFFLARRHYYAFACGKAIRFHHHRRMQARQSVLHFLHGIANRVSRCRNSMALHELFGEALARFELRRRLGRTKRGPTPQRELVHYSQRER